jgi:hypothetical protein
MIGQLASEKEHDYDRHFAVFERLDATVDELRTMFGRDGQLVVL